MKKILSMKIKENLKSNECITYQNNTARVLKTNLDNLVNTYGYVTVENFIKVYIKNADKKNVAQFFKKRRSIKMKHLKIVKIDDNMQDQSVDGFEVIEIYNTYGADGLYTRQAYQEMRLMMSTGDFHMHKTKPAYVTEFDGVTTLTDLWNMVK